MWIVKCNLTYVDNGVIAETIAEHIHDPQDMPIPAPRAARRIFTSTQDALEFVQKELAERLNPLNVEATYMMDEASPPPDLFH